MSVYIQQSLELTELLLENTLELNEIEKFSLINDFNNIRNEGVIDTIVEVVKKIIEAVKKFFIALYNHIKKILMGLYKYIMNIKNKIKEKLESRKNDKNKVETVIINEEVLTVSRKERTFFAHSSIIEKLKELTKITEYTNKIKSFFSNLHNETNDTERANDFLDNIVSDYEKDKKTLESEMKIDNKIDNIDNYLLSSLEIYRKLENNIKIVNNIISKEQNEFKNEITKIQNSKDSDSLKKKKINSFLKCFNFIKRILTDYLSKVMSIQYKFNTQLNYLLAHI